jgi:hypothetical protein
MGVAYLAQAARAMMPGGVPPTRSRHPEGPAALERAMQLNPTHAEAMATHGGVQAFMGLYQRAGRRREGRGRDEPRDCARAHNRRVRLQRAFSGINLPDALATGPTKPRISIS